MTKTYPNWTYGMEIETWGEIKVNSSDDIIHIYDENGKKNYVYMVI